MALPRRGSAPKGTERDDWVSDLETLIEALTGSDIVELDVSHGDARIVIQRDPANILTPRPTTGAAQPPPASPSALVQTLTVVAPVVGIYRQPIDGAIGVADTVEPGHFLGAVEAMGMPSRVASERAGRIIAVHVSDEQAVEYGQPLFEIEPTP